MNRRMESTISRERRVVCVPTFYWQFTHGVNETSRDFGRIYSCGYFNVDSINHSYRICCPLTVGTREGDRLPKSACRLVNSVESSRTKSWVFQRYERRQTRYNLLLLSNQIGLIFLSVYSWNKYYHEVFWIHETDESLYLRVLYLDAIATILSE